MARGKVRAVFGHSVAGMACVA